MALRLTRTRTVALLAAVLVCAVAAVWLWRDPMAPLRNGFALQGWWIGLSERQVVVGDHRWVYDESDADDPTAATLVMVHGFTGGKDALDPPWGFFQTFSHGEGYDPARIVGVLGNPHTIVWPGVSIKPYPCGVLGHPTMDAMRRLVLKHGVQPEQIAAIRVRAGSNILNPLRYAIATNELEAKFCLSFMVSAIALRRKAGIREFNDEFVQSAPVQALMRKVERVLDPEIEA